MIKFFVMSAALLIGASAHADCGTMVLGISGCFTTATVDSGTGRTCDGNKTACGCLALDSVAHTSPCPNGYSETGLRMDGKVCCHNDMAAPKVAVDNGLVQTTANNDVSEVYEPDVTALYFGYEDTTLRSPNIGRANSIQPRLDICLGGTDVDSITATGWNASGEASCETNCGQTSKNEYCNANSAAVCKDRCTCLYGYNGVTGIPTCQNL